MRASEKVDPRVKRTRELLMQAFTEVLAEKGFHRLTIQDIADRAQINRVTFYGHFSDKYAILEHWLCEEFQRQITSTLPTTCTLNIQNLEMLILTTMQWFDDLHHRAKPEDRPLLPLLFQTIPQELSKLLTT